MLRVPVSEVLYLKAELKYVTLRTAEHTYVLDEALTDLEQRLGARFLRLHRNALVARRAVRTLERRAIAGEGDDDAGEGWAVCVARSTNGSRCRAGRWPPCAKRCWPQGCRHAAHLR